MKVFMYAGQGSQFIGMGADLDREFPEFRAAAGEAELEFDAIGVMREGPEAVLNDTRYTQPCMAVFAAGVTAVLRNHGILPEAVCGLSLGEYGALYAAGVWETKEYIELTAFRGKAMAEAAAGKEYVMSAVLNAEDEKVEGICREIRDSSDPDRFVYPVNFNCPGQVVICGDAESVERAERRLGQEPRARTMRLKTTSPFHTPALEAASRALREQFDSVRFRRAEIPVAMNVTGRLLSPEEDLRTLLAAQVINPVRFRDDLSALLAEGADDFIEIGPGNVLAGLCKRTAKAMGKTVRIRSIQTAEDLRELLGN